MPPRPLEVDDNDESYRVRRKAWKLADNSDSERPAKGSLEVGEATQEEFERVTKAVLRILEDRERNLPADLKRKVAPSALGSAVNQTDSPERPLPSRREADEAKGPGSVRTMESNGQGSRERGELIKETDRLLLRMKATPNEAGEESLRRNRQQEQLERVKTEPSGETQTHRETFQSREVQRTEKRVASDESQVKEGEDNERGLKRLRMYEPTIRGHKIGSFEEFNEIVDRDFPGVRDNELFNRFVGDVEKHFKLRELARTDGTLGKGDIALLGREIGKTFGVTEEWVKGKQPKDYELLDGAISKSEAAERIRRLIEINGGIKSMEDVKRRLANYYAAPEYESSPNYQKDLKNAERYFKFLDTIREGGLVTEIGRRLGIGEGQVTRWLEGSAPWMIRLASSIPGEEPREGHIWMPLTTGPKNNPSNFIRVPVKVETYKKVQKVLRQLKPIDSQSIVQMRERFGPSTTIDSFMYSLGTFLSDAHAQKTPESNLAGSHLKIGLGRVYDWSIDYGEGFCYHLGLLGLQTYREKDVPHKAGSSSYPSSGAHVWQSESSPLVTWMRRSCLGIPDGKRKTDTPVDADWILSAPRRWRVSFLSGISDGDGWASIPNLEFGIATACNGAFIKQLLGTFGITAHEAKWKVLVNAGDSLDRVIELQPFRYAKDRKSNLEKIGEMKKTFDNSRVIGDEQRHRIESLRAKGVSWGRISERIYDEYGYSWRYDVIMRKIRKLETTETGE